MVVRMGMLMRREKDGVSRGSEGRGTSACNQPSFILSRYWHWIMDK